MRFAQVIRRFSFEEWGGTENVVWNSAAVLRNLGDLPEILATQALNPCAHETIDGVDIRRFPYLYPYFPMGSSRRAALDKKGGNPFVPSLEAYLKKEPFDLIHCHNLGRLLELSRRVAEKRGIPYVVSLHGGCLDVPEAERAELVRPLRGTFSWGGAAERLLRLRRDGLGGTDGIICVGENELSELRARFPGKRVLFLPNGVSPEKYQIEPAFDWRAELNIPVDRPLFVTISRIDYQKNQKLLLRFAARLRARKEKGHFLLIGPVSAEWYYREMLAFIKEESLEDCVTIVPGMRPDDPRLLAAYRQADVFLLPSRHEPFGIVVLEAWSAGAPVIGARVGGLGRLIEHGRTGMLFDDDSIESLDAAWKALPALRPMLIDAARREVETRYVWPVIGQKLRDFYAEVMDARRR